MHGLPSPADNFQLQVCEIIHKVSVCVVLYDVGGVESRLIFAVSCLAETTAFVFPGQGSQSAGMCADLVSTFPEARAVLEEVVCVCVCVCVCVRVCA